MQSSGNRQTVLNDVFAEMNISHHGLLAKTWLDYVRKMLTLLLLMQLKMWRPRPRGLLGNFTVIL